MLTMVKGGERVWRESSQEEYSMRDAWGQVKLIEGGMLEAGLVEVGRHSNLPHPVTYFSVYDLDGVLAVYLYVVSGGGGDVFCYKVGKHCVGVKTLQSLKVESIWDEIRLLWSGEITRRSIGSL
jgi:hypothetical protein